MAQCVVCSEDVDAATAKRFGCCPALYCDGCHEETLEGGTCGECFADLTAVALPPADSTPQLAPAVRPLTPTVFAVAPKPTMVALGTPSDCGTPDPPRAKPTVAASGTPAHERLAGDLRRVVLRKVDGNSPRSSPPPVPSPKIVTALQSGALRPTGSDATPRTATVKRFNDAEKALQRARETAAAAQAVQEAAVKETAARRQAAERAAAARSRNEARMPPRRSKSPRARAPSAKSPRRRSKSPMRRQSSVDLEAGPTVVKLKTAVAELSEANRKRTTGPRPRRSLSRRLAALLAGLLAFGAVSFYTAASVLEAPSNRGAVPPPRKRTSRRYLGTNSSKKKRLRGAA